MATEATSERLTEDELDDIERYDAAATAGPWLWWTSNSMRRLSSVPGGKDGDVAHARIAVDGMPDISIREEDMALVEAYRKAAPRMARELRRLYDIDDAHGLTLKALSNALERERVLQVEAEQLRAELVRTRAETTIDEGEAG